MKNSIAQGNFINKHQLKANENEELPKFLFMAVMLWILLHCISLTLECPGENRLCLIVQDRLEIHLFLKFLQ